MTTTDPPPTDAQLVARFQAGDARAGNILLARYIPELDRFFYNKSGAKISRDEAEDLRQRTLICVARAIHGFRGDASFRTFVYTIAHRRLRDRLDHAQTGRGKVNASYCSIEDIFGFCEFEDPFDRPNSGLIEALRSLSLEDQTLLELRYFSGLSYHEIAESLGETCPIGTLKWRVSRAKKRLRAALLECDEVTLDDAASPAPTSASLAARLRHLGEMITALLGAPPQTA